MRDNFSQIVQPYMDRGVLRCCPDMLSAALLGRSDIGGYAGGGGGPQHLGFDHNIYSPQYLQLLTRWFQFGVLVGICKICSASDIIVSSNYMSVRTLL